jgi:nitrogen fixation protein FixH
MSSMVAKGRELTGRKVLVMIVGFFAVVFLVNGVMIHLALKTFPGVQEKQPYERGLAYDREIEEARAQGARGWSADGQFARISQTQAELTVMLKDRDGEPLRGLEITAHLVSPQSHAQDLDVTLREAAPGEYRVAVAAATGTWTVDLVATQQGEQKFRSRNRVSIR